MSERDLFVEALRIADPAERAAYLVQACAGDAGVLRRVELLLAAHYAMGESLEGYSSQVDSTDQPSAPPPTDGTKSLSPGDPPSTAPERNDSGKAQKAETKLLSSAEPFGPDSTVDWTAQSRPNGSDGAGLSQFDLLAELGRGGMGVVFKARHRQLNRTVALKMISDGKHASPEHRERFLIEAEAVARLRHPNIVQIYDIGEAEGRPFVTLELLSGGSLSDRLKGTTQPGRAAAELVATLALAMHAAHQAGIVHRDLKPGNVLFDEEGTPKITDFGLAKRLEVEEGNTRTGQVMGTPCYMAPEQARGEAHGIRPPADIYALGAILYEMLTGRPPFKGSSAMETLHQVVYDDVVPPSRLQPRIARDLETICLKCLQKDPQKRYATAGELADDLRRYLDNRPVRARRTPLWERGMKWAGRHPTTATLIGLGIAAALVLVVAYRDLQIRREAVVQARATSLSAQRARCERELDEAQVLLLGQKWTQGQVLLGKLLTELKNAHQLGDLRRRAERLRAQAETGHQAETQRREDSERHRLFVQRRDEAFFHETRFTGLDLPANVQATRAAVRGTLAVVAEERAGDRWTFGPPPRTLPAQDQAEIVEGCYELLLVLADAVAEPLAGEDRVVQAERALAILDQAPGLRSEPTPTYHRQRADYLARKADAAGSARERAAADRLRPTTVLDHFLAGREAYRRDDWKTAIEELDTVVRMRPGHFWALALGSIASLQLHQPGIAKLGLSACIDRQPKFAWLYLLRGFAAGKAAVQARVAGKALGIKDGSFEVGAEAQFAVAEADFAKALELLHDKPNDELRWIVLVDRGLMRLQRNQLAEAAADLRQAIALNGAQYLAYSDLAQVLQRQKKWDEAVELFTQAIALKPGWAPLYRGRAAVQQERDDQSPAHRTAALADLDSAIRHEKPDNPVLALDHTGRGVLLRRDRHLDDAVAACEAALKIAPDFDTAHRLRVMLLLDLGRPDEVIRSCDGALAKGKPWPDIYEIRGMARASRGNYLGAIDDYSAALLLRPGQPRVLASRGLAYVASESFRPALRDFDEALRRDPSNGEAHGGRGLALALQGDFHGAIAEADESLRTSPVSARRAYNAARIYAQAAIAAAATVGEKGQLAVTLVDRYQARAVALVKLALEQTPAERRAAFWQDHVAADPALRSLQRRLRPLQPPNTSNGSVTSRSERTVPAIR